MKKLSRKQIKIINNWWYIPQEIGALCAGIKPGMLEGGIDLSESENKFSNAIKRLDLKYSKMEPNFSVLAQELIAISDKKDVCDKIIEYRIGKGEQWDLLGRELGYPDCCVNAHSEKLGKNGRNLSSPFFVDDGKNIIQTDFRLNTLLNFSSYTYSEKNNDRNNWMKVVKSKIMTHVYYLIHIPCSLECEKTKKQAIKIERMMDRHFPKKNKYYKKALKKGFFILDPAKYATFDYKIKKDKVKIYNLKFFPTVNQKEAEKIKEVDHFFIKNNDVVIPSNSKINFKKIALFS